MNFKAQKEISPNHKGFVFSGEKHRK